MKIKRTISIAVVCVLLVTVLSAVMVYAPQPPDIPSSPFQEVIVANTEPIPVTVEDEPIEVINTPDFEPVQFWGNLEIPDGDWGVSKEIFEVPEGKMLIIEYISAEAIYLDVSDSLSVDVRTVAYGASLPHYLGLVEPKGRDRQYLSKEVKFYADPETWVSAGAHRFTQLNTVVVHVLVSGYLMDVS